MINSNSSRIHDPAKKETCDSKNTGTHAVSQDRKTQYSQLEDLANMPEFRTDLDHLATCLEKEKNSGLEVGRVADKWIGDKRYSRVLNAERFAEKLTEHTGRELTGRHIRNYIAACQVDALIRESGNQFPNLSVSHLAAIGNSRCTSDEEILELARRASKQNATVRQIRHLAQQLHAERDRENRTIDLVPVVQHVRQIDALDLLNEQEDRSVHCIIADWQWTAVTWGKHGNFATVHSADDPVEHLCECIKACSSKLAGEGFVFVHYSGVELLDPRIQETWQEAGFQYAGRIIWQKSCGAIMHAGTPLAVGHEDIHILCRKEHVPKSASGYSNSVTPKWAAPTNAHSGKQGDAVHPLQKPVKLMDYLISIATVNGKVLDLFAGSGSAGVAAVRRGCSYLGAELVPEYVEIANRRIALAHADEEQAVEAMEFFTSTAKPEQRQVIETAIEKSGLSIVSRQKKMVAA